LTGRQFFQNHARQFLQVTEPGQVFLKFVIHQLGILRAKLVPQDHVPELYRMRQ